MSFVHLHVHSEHSLLDGYTRIPQLVKAAKEQGAPAIGLTDHGNMAAAVAFLKACKQEDIKPIVGCELYLAAGSRFEHNTREELDRTHLVALAKNQAGLENLFKLVSIGHLEGFYYKPRIDRESLERHREGLIVLSGCIASALSQAILRDADEEADATIEWFKERFGDDYYVELQSHPSVDFLTVLEKSVQLAKKHGVKVVATNDVHYLRREDAKVQAALSAIGRDKLTSEPGKEMLDDYYLKSPSEMQALFRHLPQALTATLEIAAKVEPIGLPERVQIPLIPKLRYLAGVPERERNGLAVAYLKAECLARLTERYGDPLPQAYYDRLDYEVGVIDEAGFASYMFLVADICRFAREAGIRFGPRGSAAGALICHGLGISEPDPLAHGLLFERFLNKERIDLPDIDLDFQDDRRHEVYEYLRGTYGEEYVAHVATYGTLGAKAAVKDVARAEGVDHQLADQLTKRMGSCETIDDALKQDGVKALLLEAPELRDVLEKAQPLEGLARHASTHAAAIVISAEPLTRLAPLMRCPKDETKVQVQYEGELLQAAGLLKMDVLGLDNLTVLDRALGLIRARHGLDLDVWNLPWDDRRTYDLLGAGRVVGVFQLGTNSGHRLTREVRPRSINDLMALVAINRPGPIDYAPQYAAVKHGREQLHSPHPLLDEIVAETNGIIIYQEQVLQIARKVAGFSYGEADILRKAIGKKIASLLAEQKEKFLDKAVEHSGISREEAERIWAYFEPFARYGFNCLSGSTKVYRASASQRNQQEISLADLYKAFHANTSTGRKYRDPKRGLRILARDADGRIRPRRVVDVYKQGVKEVFILSTYGGRVIEATADHRFLTPSGWKPLGELRQYDRVIVDGGYEKLPIDGRVSRGERRGGGYRDADPGFGFPFGEHNPGYIDGGSAAFDEIGAALIAETRSCCMACGRQAMLQRHHKDGDRTHNTRENIEVLCDSCHKRADYALGKRRSRWAKGHLAIEDEVAYITRLGEVQTYDLEVEGETDDDHNFVANGFVVHNCAHACCYAYLAFQTAYLKAHYPLEFMCALLDVARDKHEKIALGVAECAALGIEVLPPDVNRSEVGFAIEGSAIRFGLSAVKNVGTGAAEAIVANRPYRSLGELVEKANVTKGALEALIKCGGTGFATRTAELATLDRVVRAVGRVRRQEEVGQLSMFDATESLPAPDPSLPEAPLKERLGWERDLCGVWVSDNPLKGIGARLGAISSAECEVGERATLVGELRNLRLLVSRQTSKRFIAGELADVAGMIKVVCFPRAFSRTMPRWVEGQLSVLSGKVDEYDNERQLVVDQIEEYREPPPPDLVVQVPFGPDPTRWLEYNALIDASQGEYRVRIELVGDDRVYAREALVAEALGARLQQQ